MYYSSKISINELFFYQNYAIESLLFESYMLEGYFDMKLEPINEKIKEVEKKHGLKKDEYWLKNEGPEEYQKLNNEYDSILSEEIKTLFKKLASSIVFKTYNENRKQFYEKKEIGHKSLNTKDDIKRLKELCKIYEEEVNLNEISGAFLSSAIIFGAIIETKILIKCLTNIEEVKEAKTKFNRQNPKDKIKSNNPNDWTLNTLINISVYCNWLPDIKTSEYIFSTEKICHFIRNMRNLVHPIIHIKKSTSLKLTENNYTTFKNSYKLICIILDENK